MVLTLNPEPTSDAGLDEEICISDSSHSITGSTSSNGTILWTSSGDGSFDATATDNPAYTTGSEMGSVTLTKTVSSAGSCADAVDFMILTLTPGLISDAGNGGDECDLDFVLSATLSIGTGTWTKTSGSGNAVFAPNANAPNATVTVDAYDTYQFTWTEINGICSDDSTITVNFYEQPLADAGSGGDECDLDFAFSATSSATAGAGNWSQTSGPGTATFTPGTVSPNAVVTVDVYGTYEFIWTEINGTCSDNSIITVNFYEQPVANAGPGGDECDLDFVLNATPSAGTGTWTKTAGPGIASFTPDEYDPQAIVTVTTYGTYEFIRTEVNDICADDISIAVNFYQQPVANAGPDQIPDFPREITMQAELTGSETGEWSVVSGSGDFEDIHLPMTRVSGLPAGENIFSWKVTNGVCTDIDEMKIIIDDLLIPSVITPNGDMKNDYFVVRGIDISKSVELTVFNRWSAEVYKNNMFQNNWDGRDHNGNELPADTYFYMIKLVDGRVLKGFVVIKR